MRGSETNPEDNTVARLPFARGPLAAQLILPLAIAVFVGSMGYTQNPVSPQGDVVISDTRENGRHPRVFSVAEAVRLSEQINPRFAAAASEVAVARGKLIQSRAYPNPVLAITGEELSDPEGPGIWTAPFVSQEIVTPAKRDLDQAIARCEMERSRCLVAAARRKLFADVRQAYCEALTAERRAETYRELLTVAEASLKQSVALFESRQGTRLDVVRFELEVERLRAEKEAADREIPLQRERLAAAIGTKDLGEIVLENLFVLPLPEYGWEAILERVLSSHPEVWAAQWEVQRTRYVSHRARKEKIPNVSIGAGYTRQNETRGDDWTLGISLPLPLWDRNQGNILAAEAQLAQATHRVEEVRTQLREQLAIAFQAYLAARSRVERYQREILPRVQETVELARRAYAGGVFEYLRLLEAQKAEAETRLEYIASLGEAWRAAAIISGITGDEIWPAGQSVTPAK